MTVPYQMQFELGLEDLDPIMAGEAMPLPDRGRDPRLSRAVVICHVRSGYGVFRCRGIEHRVGPGQAFLILPGEEADCHPVPGTPWDYAWICFAGKLASRFSDLPPVFTLPKGSFPDLYGLRNASGPIGYLLSSDLFTLYAKLLDPRYQERDYIQLIVEHIEKNYMQKLTVENFALRFNMDRRYLSQQFKAKKGISIRTFLTQVRVTNAAALLSKGCSTSEASTLCGFGNTSNFHKMFTAHYGMTPNEWKRMHNA